MRYPLTKTSKKNKETTKSLKMSSLTKLPLRITSKSAVATLTEHIRIQKQVFERATTPTSKQSAQNQLIDLQQRHITAKTILSTELLPILKNVALHSKEFQKWGNSTISPKHLKIDSISGAMTNVIYKCELLKDPSDTETIDIEADAILIRLYGDGTEAFFDRQEELTVFSSLANLKYGSHALLCQFENGRCERFFTGSETLTIEELCNKDKWINGAMGREVAIFHSLPVFETTPSYNQVVHDFLDTVRHCYNGLVENSKSTWFDKNGVLLQAKKEESDLEDLETGQKIRSDEERIWLHNCIYNELPQQIESIEKSLLNASDKYNQNVVFGHNDLQPGNILIANYKYNNKCECIQTGKVTFIDFEYSRCVPRGYDIVNYWCEWAADYHGSKPHLMNYNKFPTEEQQKEFIVQYLNGLNDNNEGSNEQQVNELIEEVLHFEQLSHLWWGIWGLMQATQSSIDFDYLGYGKCRLDKLKRGTRGREEEV